MNPKEVKKYKLLDVCELVAGSRANKSETGIFPKASCGFARGSIGYVRMVYPIHTSRNRFVAK